MTFSRGRKSPSWLRWNLRVECAQLGSVQVPVDLRVPSFLLPAQGAIADVFHGGTGAPGEQTEWGQVFESRVG